ncbi:hypothetical protein AN191_03420 [Loktanella sp. 5RATIMAR09]|nr:hypothetical protein AN191_03420 [Loktanella sp. 5RATIMAR09]
MACVILKACPFKQTHECKGVKIVHVFVDQVAIEHVCHHAFCIWHLSDETAIIREPFSHVRHESKRICNMFEGHAVDERWKPFLWRCRKPLWVDCRPAQAALSIGRVIPNQSRFGFISQHIKELALPATHL